MKIVSCLLWCCFSGVAVRGQSQKAPIAPVPNPGVAAFIPAGYDLFPAGRAAGDLNGDGRADVALVLRLRDRVPATPQRPPRLLLVLWGAASGYRLAARSSQAVQGTGGMNQETFQRVVIRGGVLVLDHYSASNWFWRVRATFRHQAGAFYLIGETTESGRTGGACDGQRGPAGWRYRDTNFISGAYESWHISEECQLLEHQQGRAKRAQLRPLASYKTPEL